MLLHTFEVLLQEVPGEISLTFYISECPLKCKGCHSPLLWSSNGTELTSLTYYNYLMRYQGLATCVLFMGGDWDDQLVEFLEQAKGLNFKTALYSGYNISSISSNILDKLDYLKYGPWVNELGGLASVTTNQQFIHVPTMQIMNKLFQR